SPFGADGGAAAARADARRPLKGARLHRRHRAGARDRPRLRRPRGDRRRSQGSLHARSPGAHQAMNVLIVRLGALGDLVHAVPAVAALRRAFPAARLDWLVEAKHRTIVDLLTAVDRPLVPEGPTPRRP